MRGVKGGAGPGWRVGSGIVLASVALALASFTPSRAEAAPPSEAAQEGHESLLLDEELCALVALADLPEVSVRKQGGTWVERGADQVAQACESLGLSSRVASQAAFGELGSALSVVAEERLDPDATREALVRIIRRRASKLAIGLVQEGAKHAPAYVEFRAGLGDGTSPEALDAALGQLDGIVLQAVDQLGRRLGGKGPLAASPTPIADTLAAEPDTALARQWRHGRQRLLELAREAQADPSADVQREISGEVDRLLQLRIAAVLASLEVDVTAELEVVRAFMSGEGDLSSLTDRLESAIEDRLGGKLELSIGSNGTIEFEYGRELVSAEARRQAWLARGGMIWSLQAGANFQYLRLKSDLIAYGGGGSFGLRFLYLRPPVPEVRNTWVSSVIGLGWAFAGTHLDGDLVDPAPQGAFSWTIPFEVGGTVGLGRFREGTWRGVGLGLSYAPSISVGVAPPSDEPVTVNPLGFGLGLDIGKMDAMVERYADRARFRLFGLIIPPINDGPFLLTLAVGAVWY